MARSTPAQKPRGLASSSSMFFFLKAFQYQQGCTARDRGIGEVECRKIMLTPVELQKVHHIAIRDPIDQIAQRAAEDHAQRQREQGLRSMPAQQPDYPDRSGYRDDAEQPALHPARIAEKAERRAGIMRQHQIEYAENIQAFAIAKMAGDPRLAQLVENNNQCAQGEPLGKGHLHHFNPNQNPPPLSPPLSGGKPTSSPDKPVLSLSKRGRVGGVLRILPHLAATEQIAHATSDRKSTRLNSSHSQNS